MSPYLMQPAVLVVMSVATTFAVVLLYCSITDALLGNRGE